MRPIQFPKHILLAVLVDTVGCADEASLDDTADRAAETRATREAPSTIEEAQHAILAGDLDGNSGAVQIADGASQCSGVLIGNHMILTAAHCFPVSLGSQSEGPVWLRIEYAEAGGEAWHCVNGASNATNGRCQDYHLTYVYRMAGATVSTDLAVVLPNSIGSQWENPSGPADGFYTGSLQSDHAFTAYGSGFGFFSGSGAGTMRSMQSNLADVYADAVRHVSGNQRLCHGDSGGPYFIDGSTISSQMPWIRPAIAVASIADGAESFPCGTLNGSTWASRISRMKANWINGRRQARGIPACGEHWAVPGYWNCQ